MTLIDFDAETTEMKTFSLKKLDERITAGELFIKSLKRFQFLCYIVNPNCDVTTLSGRIKNEK